MTVAYWVTGSTLDVLRKLPDDSIDLVLSSPPFFALRSYLDPDDPNKADEIGSEATPGEFLDVLLDVTEECLRVLAPHGTLAFELGDTYGGGGGASEVQAQVDGSARSGDGRAGGTDGRPSIPGRKHYTVSRAGDGFPLDKSLCLIPESYRFALAYGRNPFTGRECSRWRVRNVIRWVRPNPPVGALGDKFRPATSELVVACQSRTRYFDLDAVRAEITPEALAMAGRVDSYQGTAADGQGYRRTRIRQPHEAGGAPPLDWWEIPTHPYPGAHYATFPPALCVKPIEAMCPTKVCVTCGEPSRRITEVEYEPHGHRNLNEARITAATIESGVNPSAQAMEHGRATKNVETIGWTDCGHNTWRVGRVLDPFAGSGTTLSVATGHGRDAIGIDLDIRNLELARARVGLFLQESSIDEIGGLL